MENKYNELTSKGFKLTVTSKGQLSIVDAKGKSRNADDFSNDFEFDVAEMIEYIKHLQDTTEDPNGTFVYIDLPVKEACLDDECDLTEADKYVWEGLRFGNDSTKFYVRDSKDCNTYTAFLTSASAADKADAKVLKEAFYNNRDYDPVFRAKQVLKNSKIKSKEDFNQCWNELPATAWRYYKVFAYKSNDKHIWKRLTVLRGEGEDLYKEFINYEGQFRRLPEFRIEPPVNLTNSKDEAAIAYVDLDALDRKYKSKTSELWDTFLLQRLHDPDYVSIFKAWSYAIIVGKNNSRQEMWLYGNGGTGKSSLCKAFINGINKLVGKDICLAASKDTGKSNFNSEVLNKHLLVYADAKNLKSGMSEFKHNATGGDNVRIEGKGKDATSGEIYMKCLTCSNELPKVDTTDRSQSSRIIVLPFSLTDNELKQSNLMDSKNQLIGSADFQKQLNSEFELYLASCREHYIRRCPRDSNIDAHEANEYLSSISMIEIETLAEFVDNYFEITTNTKDRITLKDFRLKCLEGFDEIDSDKCVKLYKDIKIEDVYSYLERKYGLIRQNIRIVTDDGSIITPRGLTSKTYGIKIRQKDEAQSEGTTRDVCFND